MTASPFFPRSAAVSAVKTAIPDEAPGDAGSPFAITFFSALGSKTGCSRCST